MNIQWNAVRRRICRTIRLLSKRIGGIRWVCDHCGNTEYEECEVWCWKCGRGQMLYRGPVMYR